MSDITETLKKHKTAVAVGAAGIVLLYILTRGSSSGSSSNGSGAVQIAQLQASQNLQQAQIQASQNETQISATTQDTQTAAELDAQQNQLAVEAALGLQSQGSQASLASEQLGAEINQNATYENLVAGIAPGITSELTSGKLAGHEALQESDVNTLGLLLGNASGLGSYDSAVEGGLAANDSANSTQLGELLSFLGGGSSGSGGLASLVADL